jgi:hypothetical protein
MKSLLFPINFPLSTLNTTKMPGCPILRALAKGGM